MDNAESKKQSDAQLALDPLLQVRDLHVRFATDSKSVQAVKGLDLRINNGEIFGLMGESGSGKTVTAFSILRLIEPPGEITSGEILFEGDNLLERTEKDMEALRGRRISMIFQEPIPSLNPVFTVGTQIAWYYRSQNEFNRQSAMNAALDQLGRVGFAEPEQMSSRYPHQLSGGEAQRVAIALALIHNPNLLIADEPTSALDLTVQNQILNLLNHLYQDTHRSLLLISHNLLVIERLAQRIAILYAGHTVEEAPAEELLSGPLHPYTQGLLQRRSEVESESDLLPTIPGTSPDPRDLPPACRFAPRCEQRHAYNLTICAERQPDMIEVTAGHRVRCYLYQSHLGHQAPLASQTQGSGMGKIGNE
jgi:oligopeptide/dipeptide ABC transporter ATP-binding protein